jgi:hypothetical protein
MTDSDLSSSNRFSHAEQIRSAGEAARRCIVLYAVLAAGHGEPRVELVSWLRREGLWDAVSPKESEFLLAETPTQRQRVDATWRAEALFPLLWSLGLISELPSPQQLGDVQLIRSVLPPLLGSVSKFISAANLRGDSEIHDANEKTYKIHWRIRDARVRDQPAAPGRLPRIPVADGEPPAKSYHAGVVQERHYALNWLIGYCGQPWDDITTDT